MLSFIPYIKEKSFSKTYIRNYISEDNNGSLCAGQQFVNLYWTVVCVCTVYECPAIAARTLLHLLLVCL